MEYDVAVPWLIGILGIAFVIVCTVMATIVVWEAGSRRNRTAENIEEEAIRQHLEAEKNTSIKLVK